MIGSLSCLSFCCRHYARHSNVKIATHVRKQGIQFKSDVGKLVVPIFLFITTDEHVAWLLVQGNRSNASGDESVINMLPNLLHSIQVMLSVTHSFRDTCNYHIYFTSSQLLQSPQQPIPLHPIQLHSIHFFVFHSAQFYFALKLQFIIAVTL